MGVGVSMAWHGIAAGYVQYPKGGEGERGAREGRGEGGTRRRLSEMGGGVRRSKPGHRWEMLG